MLCNRIKQCRTARGLTRKQLADAAQVDVRTITRLENCTHGMASWETMRAIAGALGLRIDSVFMTEEKKTGIQTGGRTW